MYGRTIDYNRPRTVKEIADGEIETEVKDGKSSVASRVDFTFVCDTA
jgi:hypothetical protein